MERESTYTSGSGSTNPSTTSSSSGHAYAVAATNMNTIVDVVIPERDEHVGWVDLSGNTPASTMLREMKAGVVKVSSSSMGERNVVGVPPMSPSASVESSEHSGSRVSLGGGGFLSKAKIKRKKKGESAVTSTTGTVSSSSFSASVHSLSSKSHSNGYSGSGGAGAGAGGDSGWVDTKELKKAAKAEEKRRKKAEEKARLEKLAEQFSAGRQKASGGATGDVTSVISSSGSSERRRAANEWIEDSVGMYGNMGFAAF